MHPEAEALDAMAWVPLSKLRASAAATRKANRKAQSSKDAAAEVCTRSPGC
jgi:hypothetical protein